MRAISWWSAAALATCAACAGDVTETGRGGALALDVVMTDGAVGQIDQGRITLEGPTPRSITVVPGTTQTIAGLTPGNYTVVLEGLTGGEVETFGEQAGVTVAAGVNTPVTVTMSSFVPAVAELPPLVEMGEDIVVQFTPVANAVSYVVEWATNAAFAGAQATTTTSTSVAIRPATSGNYHVRVRARNRLGANGRATARGPVEVPMAAIPTDQRFISAGGSHVCALDRIGRAYCWGRNALGQLGNGTNDHATVPVAVAGGRAFVSISAAYIGSHTCGLERSGKAYCWGFASGLGTGQNTNANTPQEVSGDRTFVSLSAGSGHTCGVAVDGVAYCWGNNGDGQLGDGIGPARFAPAPVSTELRFLGIAAGSSHTCGVTTAREVWCWGGNATGQLGTGQAGASRSTPTRVEGLPAMDGVTAGAFHTCAWSAGGTAYCWGRSLYGRLGDNDPTEATRPPRQVQQVTSFTRVSAGNGFTCGITTSRQVYCWGFGMDGRLGSGTETHHAVPNPVPVSDAVDIAAGGVHACALTAAGEAHCWGMWDVGALGNGKRAYEPTPVPVTGGPSTVGYISAGFEFTCASASNAVPFCWGRNAVGQLSTGDTLSQNAPRPMSFAQPYRYLAANVLHVCGINVPGAASCVGSNSAGQLGDGSTTSSNRPVPVASGFLWTSITAGNAFTCGIPVQAQGSVHCWGSNAFGKLGNGGSTGSSHPYLVAGLSDVRGVSAFGDHACAVTGGGGVHCWGRGGSGQLGNGQNQNASLPVQAVFLPAMTVVSAGLGHTCALDEAGRAYCWGAGESGQLGDDAFTSSATPVAVAGGVRFSSIRAGGSHTCGVAVDGTGYCWGNGAVGQLGNGTLANAGSPTPISGGLRFLTGTTMPGGMESAIQPGASHTCGLATALRVYCWGSNDFGKLGIGHFPRDLSPSRVTSSVVFRSQ